MLIPLLFYGCLYWGQDLCVYTSLFSFWSVTVHVFISVCGRSLPAWREGMQIVCRCMILEVLQ